MTVRRTDRVLAAAVLAFAAAGARAETIVLKHAATIVADSKEALLKAPEGVGCAGGALVVADTANGRLVLYGMKDGIPTGGTEVRAEKLVLPTRVQLDAGGGIWVLDWSSRRIARLDPKGAFQRWVELTGTPAPVVPGGFKLDGDALVVLDVAGRAVVVADGQGAMKRRVPLPEKGTFTDVAVDRAGNLYAVDASGAAVWVADKAAQAFKPLTRDLGQFVSFPTYIVATNRGTLLLVDQNGSGIVLLGIDGSYQGRQLSMGVNEGLVYYPTQICMDADGVVAVADRNNNRVQLFTTR
jgi:sugar lactone lactonase YvrE